MYTELISVICVTSIIISVSIQIVGYYAGIGYDVLSASIHALESILTYCKVCMDADTGTVITVEEYEVGH